MALRAFNLAYKSREMLDGTNSVSDGFMTKQLAWLVDSKFEMKPGNLKFKFQNGRLKSYIGYDIYIYIYV